MTTNSIRRCGGGRVYTRWCRKCSSELPAGQRNRRTCAGCRPGRLCVQCGAKVKVDALVAGRCASCQLQLVLPIFRAREVCDVDSGEAG